MSDQSFASVLALASLMVVVSLAPSTLIAQVPAAGTKPAPAVAVDSAKPWSPPRTADGGPAGCRIPRHLLIVSSAQFIYICCNRFRATHTSLGAPPVRRSSRAVKNWFVEPIVIQTGSPVAALEGNRERVLNTYSRLPLAFVQPRGPPDSRVWFYAGLPVRVPLHTKTDGNVMGFARALSLPAGLVPQPLSLALSH